MLVHDASPPANWPDKIVYLTRTRLSSAHFPPRLTALISDTAKFAPIRVNHPASVAIKPIIEPSHPAHGQNGLFARQKIAGQVLIIPYFGIIHASFTRAEDSQAEVPIELEKLLDPAGDPHRESDYDLSLLRVSAADSRNPYPGYHISVGVDAASAGNAARMVNDYRGVAERPNAEFKVGRGEGGEMRMEVWSLKSGLCKGEEVLVSYGKGWWGARNAGGIA